MSEVLAGRGIGESTSECLDRSESLATVACASSACAAVALIRVADAGWGSGRRRRVPVASIMTLLSCGVRVTFGFGPHTFDWQRGHVGIHLSPVDQQSFLVCAQRSILVCACGRFLMCVHACYLVHDRSSIPLSLAR